VSVTKPVGLPSYQLLSADLAFIVLHCVWRFTALLEDERFALSEDLGFSEVYQYVKEFWIVMLLGYLAVKRRSFVFFNWALLFVYFLLDDSLQIHEKMGRTTAARLGLPAVFGLRSQDMGELVVSGVVGSVFLVILAASYWLGRRTDRTVFRQLLVFVLIMLFFGVVVDMGYWILHPESIVWLRILALIEDGGELPAMSLILLYTTLLASGGSLRIAKREGG
jgi:hypothetical protein